MSRRKLDPAALPEPHGSIRYPEIHVAIHSPHPLALVSAVRYALRRAGVRPAEISTFSRQALAPHSGEAARRVCTAWVHVDTPAA